jgi:RNA polymerase sigma-70 factor (ECF subfamily)
MMQMSVPSIGYSETFEVFYRSEYARMVALAAAVSGAPASAEDVAQEALIRAHREWAKVSRYEKPGAWLRRITINLASNKRRRANTERRLAPGPQRQTVELQLRDHSVWAAVAELPPRQRAAIALYYLEDRAVEEIAEILNCAPGTAKAHLHQGRKALHDRLEHGEQR